MFCAAALCYTTALFVDQSITKIFLILLWQWCAATALLIIVLIYPPFSISRIAPVIGKGIAYIPISASRLALICTVLVTTLCAYFSGALFHHVPHINDSLNQYVHAKFLASGHIAIDSHPLKEFFDSGWMINDGRWYSAYPPGHILLLALGHLVGLPWLVNPIVGGMTIIAVYYLATELYGKPTAIVAVILASLCPMLLFMSSEYMNHATALLSTTLFVLFFVRMRNKASIYDALPAGAALGYLAITRPYTAFAIALPFAFIGIYDAVRKPRRYFKPFMAAAMIIVAFVCFYGFWNVMTTGDFFTPAYYKMFGDDCLPGLNRNQGGTQPHAIPDGMQILLHRVIAMNESLFEWPIASLSFVLLLFVVGPVLAADWMLLSVYLSLCLTYAFFQGSSEFFGPRYHYEAISSLIILTAASLTRIPVFVQRLQGRHLSSQSAFGIIVLLLLILFMLSLPGIKHKRAIYENHYGEGNYDYYRDIEVSVRKPALVFVKDLLQPYLYVAFTLPPAEDSPIIFARNKHERNIDLIRYYPCRYAYMKVEGNSEHESQLVLLYNPPPYCRYQKQLPDR